MVNPTVVTLTQGCVALVSKEDWPLVSRHRWHAVRVAGGRIYAATTINGKRMYLHRFLVPGFAVVHHRNNDGLDNRRDNLLGASRGGLNIAAAPPLLPPLTAVQRAWVVAMAEAGRGGPGDWGAMYAWARRR